MHLACKSKGLFTQTWMQNEPTRKAVAEPDLKFWGGRYKNKLKYINHIIYNTTHFGVVHKKFKQNNTKNRS
jgi:hypothetical protein